MRLLWALLLSGCLPAQAGTVAVAGDSSGRRPYDPLYEGYPVVRDYRLNQTLEGAIRWTALGLVLGGMVGGLLETSPEFPLVTMASVATGAVAGCGAGAIAGYHRGKSWEMEKSLGGTVHARRDRVGFEADFGQGLSAFSNARDYGQFALAFRLAAPRRWAPDEYQLVAGSQRWHSDDRNENHANEGRFGFRVFKSFRDALVNPIAGLGAGLSRGTTYDYSQPWPAEASSREFETAYVEALAGVELNVFDFFHGRLQAAGEPFGPYHVISRHGDYDPWANISLRASFGASLF